MVLGVSHCDYLLYIGVVSSAVDLKVKDAASYMVKGPDKSNQVGVVSVQCKQQSDGSGRMNG